MSQHEPWENCPVPLTDEDVLTAMKAISGYIDITPGDFKEVYRLAYAGAVGRILASVKARDVMTATVISVNPEMDLTRTADLLANKGISGAPVVNEGGGVVGVISEKDFLSQMGVRPNQSFMAVIAQCLNNKGCLALPIRKRIVGEIMSVPAITAWQTTTIAEIAALFTARNINRVPIIGPDGKLLGIVTRRDIVNAYCRLA